MQRFVYLLKRNDNLKKREFLHDSFKMLMSSNPILSFNQENNNSNDDEQTNINTIGMGTLFKSIALFPNTLNKIIEMRGGAPVGFNSTINLTKKK